MTVVADILAGFVNVGFVVGEERPLPLFCSLLRVLAFLTPVFLKKLLVEGDIFGELEGVLLSEEEEVYVGHLNTFIFQKRE